jgi:type I restriction enzyme S subunit
VKGWEVKKLSDLCDVFADGDWIETKDQSVDGVRLIQTGNVGEGFFKDRGEKARYISEQTFSRLRCTEIFDGDCLISRLPDPVGRSCILPNTGERMITAVDCTIVRFKKNKLIPQFFNFYSQSGQYLTAVERETTGTTRKRISRSKLAEIPIPLPPLPEQRRIVAILDEAFAGLEAMRANAEKNLQNARDLFDSRLQGIFTRRADLWERVSLETLLERGWIESHLDGNHGSDYPRKEEFISEGVPYISANCLVNERIDMAKAKYLSPKRAALLRKGIAMNGDVLFAHNATVGPVAVLRTKEKKVILGTSLTYYRCNKNKILSEYLSNYMRSFEFRKQYSEVMRQSTRNQVPITKQREFFHIIPPLAEQASIVEQLENLFEGSQRLESIYRQKLSTIAELKQSILQKAFSGQLTSAETIAA